MKRNVLSTLLALALCAAIPQTLPQANADSKDDLIAQREANAKKRERLVSELEGVSQDLSKVYLQLEDTRAQKGIAETELAQAQSELAGAVRTQEHVQGRLTAAQGEQARLETEIKSVSGEISATRGALAEVVRTSYRSGGASLGSLTELYEIGVGENSVTELAAREAAVRTQTRVLSQLADLQAQSQNAQARQQTVTELIADLKVQADQAVATADAARQQKEAKANEIASLEANQQSLAAQLADRKDEIEAQRAQTDKADAELRDEIAKIVAEEKRKAEEERKRREAEERKRKEEQERKRREEAERRRRQPQLPAPAPAPVNPAPVKPAPAPGPGKQIIEPPIPRPLYVTSPWGYRIYPITGGWFMHNGVDLASACGDPQYAAAAGTITATKNAATNGTHGNQVIINHGTMNGAVYITVYNHMSRFAVTPGQQVSQGQLIGYTGATGLVTGCHVHFEVWRNGTTIDPMRLPGF